MNRALESDTAPKPALKKSKGSGDLQSGKILREILTGSVWQPFCTHTSACALAFV